MHSPILILCLLTAAGVLAELSQRTSKNPNARMLSNFRYRSYLTYIETKKIESDCCKRCQCARITIMPSSKLDLEGLSWNKAKDMLETRKIHPDKLLKKTIKKFLDLPFVVAQGTWEEEYVGRLVSGLTLDYRIDADNLIDIDRLNRPTEISGDYPYEGCEFTVTYYSAEDDPSLPPRIKFRFGNLGGYVPSLDQVKDILKQLMHTEVNMKWLSVAFKHFVFLNKEFLNQQAQYVYQEDYDDDAVRKGEIQLLEFHKEMPNPQKILYRYDRFSSDEKAVISFQRNEKSKFDYFSLVVVLTGIWQRTQLRLVPSKEDPSRKSLELKKLDRNPVPLLPEESLRKILAALVQVPLEEVDAADVAGLSKIVVGLASIESTDTRIMELKTQKRPVKTAEVKI